VAYDALRLPGCDAVMLLLFKTSMPCSAIILIRALSRLEMTRVWLAVCLLSALTAVQVHGQLRQPNVASSANPGSTPLAAGARGRALALLPEKFKSRKLYEGWGLSEAIRIDDRVYVSGVVASQKPGEPDLTKAYERQFDEIGTLLKRAGVGWDDVIDITSYHTDIANQLATFVQVKNRYVRAPFPAWTAIQITRLVPEDGITEVKVVAHATQSSNALKAKQ
jgi:enamine deaminase RidA (YjgF/YER057c/UK114 family)